MKFFSVLTRLTGWLVSAALFCTSSTAADPTRIIGSDDPIPDSPALTAGEVYRHAKIDRGKVAFLTGHKQFGVDKPTNSLLFWDGGKLTKIADDFTPVPGLTGGELLEFNDLTRPNTVSLDASSDPTVAFFASHLNEQGKDYAIYRWSPGEEIRTFVQPGSQISNIQPGAIANGTLVFSTWQVVPGTALHAVGIDGNLRTLIAKGDDIPDTEFGTFDFVQNGFLFEGGSILVNLATKPISLGGWYEVRVATPSIPRPIWTAEDRVESVNGAFTYWSNGIRGMSPSSSELPSAAVGIGQGTQNGSPSTALLFKGTTGSSFGVLAAKGDNVSSLPGYTFDQFLYATVHRGAAIFGATARNDQSEQIVGIYRKIGTDLDTLIDTRSTIDGKQVTSVMLHDRDGDSGTILFTAWFDDSSAGLYTLPSGGGVSFELWTQGQFPDADGDESIVGAFADPERDGVVNIVEFTLGGNGNVADPGAVTPDVPPSVPGSPVEFEYRRRVELPGNVVVTPEVSSTLSGGWQSGDAALEEISVSPDDDASFERVRVRCAGPARRVAYVRISVSLTGG